MDPTRHNHPLHSLVLSIFESRNQALNLFNSTEFVLIDSEIIKQKLQQNGMIYLLYDDNSSCSIDDVIAKLYNKSLITNINKYKTPKPLNYHNLCDKMSSILSSSNSGPNRVYVINCKQYHSFKEITTIKQVDEDNNDYDEYESDSSDGFSFVPDEDEKENDDMELLNLMKNNMAKDVTIFREYLLEKSMKPPSESITFCGMFNEYKFDAYLIDKNNNDNEDLLTPYYYFARNKLPDYKEYDHYISVGIDSNINDKNFEQRPDLNLFIVLDINQSMNESFNYLERDKSKINIIKKCLIQLFKNLKKMDRFGLILFNNQNIEIFQSLKYVKDIDLIELEKKINDEIKLKGNDTDNLCKGYSTAIALFEEISVDFKNDNQNRIIFMTDSIPKDSDSDDLIELNKKYSQQFDLDDTKQDVFCSFIALGCDFENDFVSNIMDCKGCNYFSIHSERECIEVLNDKFVDIVTPILFDIELHIKSPDNSCIIESVYGISNNDDLRPFKNGQIMNIKTLFHNSSRNGDIQNNQSRKSMVVIKVNEDTKMDDDLEIEQEVTEDDIKIEHKMMYEYDIEYEFDVCNVKDSILSIEELMEYFAIKTEWTEDHHKLITFLHENKIFNQFDLSDTQNMNMIKKKLSSKALNGDIKAQRLSNKLDDFMMTTAPLIDKNKNMKKNKVIANTESSRYGILLQKHLNKLLLTKNNDNSSMIKPSEIDDEIKQNVKDFNLDLVIKYKDHQNKSHEIVKKIKLNRINDEYFENEAIRKGVLLSNYVKICKSWINDKYDDIKLMEYIEHRFIPYFKSEVNQIGDEDLLQEIDLLNKMITITKSRNKEKNLNGIYSKLSLDQTPNSMNQMVLTYNPLQCILANNSMTRDIKQPIDIYHAAFIQNLFSTEYDLQSILPNYAYHGKTACPFKAMFDLSKDNRKHNIILVPVHISLDREFITKKCIAIAHHFDALNERGMMFFYRGLIFAINKSVLNQSKQDKMIFNDESQIMRLLEDNIDYNKDKGFINESSSMLYDINKYLNIGCGSIFIHCTDGYTIDVGKYIMDQTMNDEDEENDTIRVQLQKLLFLCNINCDVGINYDGMIESFEDKYKCQNCGDLMIHPYNNGDKYLCQICVKDGDHHKDKYNIDKKLEIKIKKELKIPLSVYKQLAMNKSIIRKRMEVLKEYFIEREKELNDYQNEMNLGQQIMNNHEFANKMAGY